MGVKALGYVVIETTQTEKWDEFLTQVAGVMRAPDAADGAALYRIDDRPFRFRLEPSTREWFKAAGYEVADRAALDALAARITAAGRPVEWLSDADASGRGVEALFRTSDPADNGLEFYCGDSVSAEPFVSPLGISHFVTGEMGMGHAVFSAPNFDETIAFHRDVVGFHETDMPRFFFGGGGPDDPGMGFAFMHAANGRHHSLALGEMPESPNGAVHIMLEVKELADVGRAYDRALKSKGAIPISATLGQHVNDKMISFYVQTPGGFDLEYGWNGLVIDPQTWVPTTSMSVSAWGHKWAWEAED